DAEVAAHRGDGRGRRPGGLHAMDQPGENLALSLGSLAVEVATHLPHVGVADRDLERDAGRDMALDQATVIEVGRGGPDAADEANMHVSSLSGVGSTGWRPA